jgi:hypothetical protein
VPLQPRIEYFGIHQWTFWTCLLINRSRDVSPWKLSLRVIKWSCTASIFYNSYKTLAVWLFEHKYKSVHMREKKRLVLVAENFLLFRQNTESDRIKGFIGHTDRIWSQHRVHRDLLSSSNFLKVNVRSRINRFHIRLYRDALETSAVSCLIYSSFVWVTVEFVFCTGEHGV